MRRRRLILLALALAAALPACRPRAVRKKPDLDRPAEKVKPLSEHFTADQTFAFVLPQLKPVQGVGGVRASQCAVCHKEIHEEWSQSTHAWALRDLQFQAEIFKPSSPRWLCLNCHIPVQNQRRTIVRGLKSGDVLRPATAPNPGFDPEMQKEAITCAVCHVRPGPGGASQIIGPRGNPKAPHPVKAEPATLHDICYRCHDPRGERITPLLVCWFETRKELEQGPMGGDATCADCHMPTKKRRLAAPLFTRFPERDSPRHTWEGGGVPKHFGGFAGQAARGYEAGLSSELLEVTRDDKTGAVSLTVELSNTAAHKLTTGDPERHLLLVARALDADGEELARQTHRIGQTWKWRPEAKKVGDNRLGVEEERKWSATLEPRAGSAAARLSLAIYHVRLTGKSATHMMKTKVQETYVEGLEAKVKQLPRLYPMARYLHHEVVELASGKRTRASEAELVRLSAAEAQRPLDTRDY